LLSEYDKECLALLARAGYEVDWVNLSHTRSAQDLRQARAFLQVRGWLSGAAAACVHGHRAADDHGNQRASSRHHLLAEGAGVHQLAALPLPALLVKPANCTPKPIT
jgi:hypothetical protein